MRYSEAEPRLFTAPALRTMMRTGLSAQDLTFSRDARLITGATTTDFNFNKEIALECPIFCAGG